MNKQLTHIGLGLTIALLLAAIYWPGLRGPYILDDHENILLSQPIVLHELTLRNLFRAIQSGESGPFKRPLASLSFALNHYIAGGFDSPFAFKATNLAIHILNAILVFCLTLRLAQTPALRGRLTDREARILAGFATGLWALHPIQLTNVLYVVQRMNSLSATFVLAGLLLFIQGRLRFSAARTKGLVLMIGGALGGMTLGMASKENAALLPLFALVIEYTLFRFHASDRQGQQTLARFYVALAALPALAFVVYLTSHPDLIADSYLTRHFSMAERVLTETRVLWFYLGLILLPTNHRLSLFHDDIGLSTGLLIPMTTLLAVVGIFAALGLALIRSRRNPVISFAILWFLAGHVLESGVFGLELAYEHRNYLPSYGILFALAVGLMTLAKNRGPAYLLAPVVVCLALGFSTWARANTWRNIETLAEHTARTHPDSARANDFAARVSLDSKNDITAAIRYTLRGLKVAPNEVGFQLDLQMLLGALATEVERSLAKPSKQSPSNSFTLRLPGLEDDIQATLTKRGLRLSHNDSSSETILALLQTQPVTVHGIVSLENLRHCLLEPPPRCAALKDAALDWFAAAAGNNRTAAEYRAILAGDAAMLYADAGNVARALDYMTRAATLLPNHVPYWVATAEFLIHLGRLDEAKRTIEKISAEPMPTDIQAAKRDLNLHKLKELYNEAIEKNSHKPSQ